MLSPSELNRIIDACGSPCYIFEEQRFMNNFNNLVNTFRTVYPGYVPAYSYKTNYTPYVCRLVKKLGGLAEVVSDMEYDIAKRIGYTDKGIIYNGPYKGEKADNLILNGGICNIDNYDEAFRVVELAKTHPENEIHVGIRINMDVGANYISRFGIEADSDDLSETVALLENVRNISIVGLHCHISRARDIDAWKKRIDTLISTADKYIKGIPRYIDVGSGMFGEMDEFLAKQFSSSAPAYREYAEVVAGAMKRRYENCENPPLLISEPGTTVIANYISLVAKVNNIKCNQGQCFATVNVSYYNTGEMCLMKKLPHTVLRNGEEITDKTDKVKNIMGFTCLEQDCIYRGFDTDIKTGDIIVFGNVGGYSIVSKPPFIHPNCAVFSYAGDGRIQTIKRVETVDDIMSTFNFCFE